MMLGEMGGEALGEGKEKELNGCKKGRERRYFSREGGKFVSLHCRELSPK